MNSLDDVKVNDLAMIGGAGCLLAIPVAIWVGFKSALKYASGKEHNMSHQVEDVELEGAAAAKREVAIDPKDELLRFAKKLERNTEQFAKLGGRFNPEDYAGQKAKLEGIIKRLPEPDAECQALLQKARASLMQYAPPGS